MPSSLSATGAAPSKLPRALPYSSVVLSATASDRDPTALTARWAGPVELLPSPAQLAAPACQAAPPARTEAMFVDLGHFNISAIQYPFVSKASYLHEFRQDVGDTFYKSIRAEE
ncbi:hypothetical protein ZWY2020_029764 [Hordeum vulgare]|nr:hypothetical protein ZWY2020_029764 [Hordeum vulgare]